jgi:arginine decarboxylase
MPLNTVKRKFFLSTESSHAIGVLKMIPKKIFFTKGVGVHKEKLASFEMALRVAGLAHCNLVLVSSIYPPGCKIVPKDEGLKLLQSGEISLRFMTGKATTSRIG